jgi:hypothetical protein
MKLTGICQYGLTDCSKVLDEITKTNFIVLRVVWFKPVVIWTALQILKSEIFKIIIIVSFSVCGYQQMIF